MFRQRSTISNGSDVSLNTNANPPPHYGATKKKIRKRRKATKRLKGAGCTKVLILLSSIVIVIQNFFWLRRRLIVDAVASRKVITNAVNPGSLTTKTTTVPVASVVSSPNENVEFPFRIKSNSNAPQCTPITAQDVEYTLVIQCSDDRLWMMEYQCERWGTDKHISIAVYTNQSHDEIWNKLMKMGCGGSDSNSLSSSTLHLSILDSSDKQGQDYPVNTLRNLALSNIQTSHILFIDIDFWVSNNLYDKLKITPITEAFASDDKLVFVIPAFQLNSECETEPGKGDEGICRKQNINRMPKYKLDITKSIKKKLWNNNMHEVDIFDAWNPKAHNSVRYQTWFQTNPSEKKVADISCINSNRFEPYLAMRYCDVMPPFQEAFTGYGKNKITWFMQARLEGYAAKQLLNGFICHYPHNYSQSRQEWNRMPKVMEETSNGKKRVHKLRPNKELDKFVDWSEYKRGQVDMLFIEYKQWLKETYQDKKEDIRLPMCSENGDDDQKLWVSADIKEKDKAEK